MTSQHQHKFQTLVGPKHKLQILDGPSRWNIMLAVFDGQTVTFVFEDKGKEFNNHKFKIYGGHFYDRDREVFCFSLLFPHKPGSTGGTGVQGEINLRSRKGFIEITHLVELGRFAR